MRYTIYFGIALAATTLGALTGMGGGVIIKPVLDVLGDYDASTINLLSSVTVFVMALVSVEKQLRQGTVINIRMAASLAVGSLLGGNIGQIILAGVIAAFQAGRMVVAVQNICLALLIMIVFLYLGKGKKRLTLGLQGILPVLLTGVTLGIISAFLGIGGGPVNVALIVFVCSCEMKTAAVYSIITILFAQVSKLATILLSGTFLSHDLSMIPVMIPGAVLGGWAGSCLSKRLSGKAVEKAFGGVQLLVLIICLFNIFRNLIP